MDEAACNTFVEDQIRDMQRSVDHWNRPLVYHVPFFEYGQLVERNLFVDVMDRINDGLDGIEIYQVVAYSVHIRRIE